MELLIKNKIIHNSHRGMVDKNENPIGYYGTKTKIYIEDKYVNMAQKLLKGLALCQEKN